MARVKAKSWDLKYCTRPKQLRFRRQTKVKMCCVRHIFWYRKHWPEGSCFAQWRKEASNEFTDITDITELEKQEQWCGQLLQQIFARLAPALQLCRQLGLHASQNSGCSIQSYFNKEDVPKAEVLLVLHTIKSNNSYRSNAKINELFNKMFPDSDIAKGVFLWILY